MAAVSVLWCQQWADQLADVADHVMQQVPDGEDWGVVRHFLQNTSRVLRRGDLRAGMRVFCRVLPYIQGGLSNVAKCTKISNTYDIAETINQQSSGLARITQADSGRGRSESRKGRIY